MGLRSHPCLHLGLSASHSEINLLCLHSMFIVYIAASNQQSTSKRLPYREPHSVTIAGHCKNGRGGTVHGNTLSHTSDSYCLGSGHDVAQGGNVLQEAVLLPCDLRPTGTYGDIGNRTIMGVHCNIFWQWVHRLLVTDKVHQLDIKELGETMAVYSNSEM